ncbi:hypothetical protein KA036_00350 [Candidatus Gracilibacteria bacterium]|nr:hypothetical protein [Candidatus Gracilibacteria bacterium]
MNRSKNLAITALTTLAALSGCFEEPRTAPVSPDATAVDCGKIKEEIAKTLENPDLHQKILTTKRQTDHATDEAKACHLHKKENNQKGKVKTTYTITCPDLYTQNVSYHADPNTIETATTKLSIPANDNHIPVSLTRTNNNLTFQVHSPEYWETVNEYNDNCTTEDPTP